MSVTFSGGITFTGGGFSFTAPPSTNPTAGWFFGGGYGGYLSLVNRITFATDTATASVRGPLSLGRSGLAGTGNTTDGWVGGGRANSGPGVVQVSVVDRTTYATDTATMSVRGPLNSSRYGLGATGTDSYGWFGGGFDGSMFSNVSRITYATDTATATARGPLSSTKYFLAASTDNTTYGWFGGGNNPSSFPISTVDRIVYATDTATATTRGTLSDVSAALGSTSTSNYGYFAGGSFPAPFYYQSTINRITYATDTATASARGPLNLLKNKLSGFGNDTYGYFGGGDGPSYTSSVSRITYATDTATASVVGPVSQTSTLYAGTSGIQ